MQMPISPLERSRQILKIIELDEKRNNNNNSIETPNSTGSREQSQEGISTEGPSVKPNNSLPPSEEVTKHPQLNLSQQDIVNGIILSEILGKPVSRRRGRW